MNIFHSLSLSLSRVRLPSGRERRREKRREREERNRQVEDEERMMKRHVRLEPCYYDILLLLLLLNSLFFFSFPVSKEILFFFFSVTILVSLSLFSHSLSLIPTERHLINLIVTHSERRQSPLIERKKERKIFSSSASKSNLLHETNWNKRGSGERIVFLCFLFPSKIPLSLSLCFSLSLYLLISFTSSRRKKETFFLIYSQILDSNSNLSNFDTNTFSSSLQKVSLFSSSLPSFFSLVLTCPNNCFVTK